MIGSFSTTIWQYWLHFKHLFVRGVWGEEETQETFFQYVFSKLEFLLLLRRKINEFGTWTILLHSSKESLFYLLFDLSIHPPRGRVVYKNRTNNIYIHAQHERKIQLDKVSDALSDIPSAIFNSSTILVAMCWYYSRVLCQL